MATRLLANILIGGSVVALGIGGGGAIVPWHAAPLVALFFIIYSGYLFSILLLSGIRAGASKPFVAALLFAVHVLVFAALWSDQHVSFFDEDLLKIALPSLILVFAFEAWLSRRESQSADAA